MAQPKAELHGLPAQEPEQTEGAPRQKDCTGCIFTGVALGLGGGTYLATLLIATPKAHVGQRLFLLAGSAAFFSVGVTRPFWYW